MATDCSELGCAPCETPRPAHRWAPAAAGRVVDSQASQGAPGSPWLPVVEVPGVHKHSPTGLSRQRAGEGRGEVGEFGGASDGHALRPPCRHCGVGVSYRQGVPLSRRAELLLCRHFQGLPWDPCLMENLPLLIAERASLSMPWMLISQTSQQGLGHIWLE